MLVSGSVISNKTSSAYKQIFCSMPPTTIPFITGSSLIDCAKGSINRAKRAGLRGQPWRQPRSSSIGCESCPLIFILALGEKYRVLKHLIESSLNPNLLSVKYKYSQRTESNAFSASRLSTTAWFFPLVTWSSICSTRLKLSCVCLSHTKPV